MIELIPLIPALPLIGFVVLTLWGSRLPKGAIALTGAGTVFGSALLASVAVTTLAASTSNNLTIVLWNWMSVGGYSQNIAFRLDALSSLMVLVITWVGFFIHLYSTEYMKEDEGYARFFAYMNLFVASMLVLVLSNNLVLLYLGWEGVGLCSYLLIGFWYSDSYNGWAARKAFVVTRVGDAAMMVGMILLFTSLGTLNIQELMTRATDTWAVGSALPVTAAALLLAGAVGKSAQLPLQTWLPDAMAGPTPVSALIHAATMVTAGVYLIARTGVLFSLAPQIMTLVAVIGLTTMIISSLSALTQNDIKRVLAYSTVSQIGYMFIALGVGAYSAAMFHFMTHAFFKALLFLASGVVIQALGHERDMTKMGGLRKELPLAYWAFIAGASSLSALPLVTAGYYSKDLIISSALTSPLGGWWLWAGGLCGALLTSLYSFRMIFMVFFGVKRGKVEKRPGPAVAVALIELIVLSIVGGFINIPAILGRSGGLFKSLAHGNISALSETSMAVLAGSVSITGVVLAYLFFLRYTAFTQRLMQFRPLNALRRLWQAGWGFDWLYDWLLVRPFIWVASVNRDDFVDLFFGGAAWYSEAMNRVLSKTQSGKIRWYAAGMAAGAVIIVGLVILL